MRDRAGFFAGMADILTAMCVYYVIAGILIMSRRGWGLHLFWPLLCAAVCGCVYPALLRKPRSSSLLTVVTGALFLLSGGVFVLASKTPVGFGYGLVLAIGAGMAAGLPLYTCLNRPGVLRHLTHLDVLILALLGLLLTREALGIDGATVALMVAVLFLDAASAVGLRMSEEGDEQGGSALRASLLALGSAVLLALLIGLAAAVFSRSGDVTGGILRGIGLFLAGLWRRIEGFFGWIAALVYREETYDALPLEGELPSLAESELSGAGGELAVNTTAVGVVMGLLVLGLFAAAVILLRKRRIAMAESGGIALSEEAGVRRTGGTLDALWQRLRDVLAFRWTAFRQRNTAAGLLVRLEDMAGRAHAPRERGESMRGFIARMDPAGGLGDLADALDLQYYGGGGSELSPRRCRELRKYMRKAVRHG